VAGFPIFPGVVAVVAVVAGFPIFPGVVVAVAAGETGTKINFI
jgi:hypothetical protein